MQRAIALSMPRLAKALRRTLQQWGYEKPQRDLLLAICLSTALAEVERQGTLLARWNVTREQVAQALDEFAALLDSVLNGRFQPAREQFRLAVDLVIGRAYFRVREAETQAFFGLYRAEMESHSLDEMLQRVLRVLTQTFQARAGRILLGENVPPELRRLLYIERGSPSERLVFDPALRGHYAGYWSYPLSDAVLQFGFAARGKWLPRDLALLQAVAERCRLQSEVRRLESEARRAEEEERRRLGRELHDETGQSLLVLRLQLEMLEREAPAKLQPRLAEARGIAESTICELRRIIAALSPAVLERLGLEASLRHLAARFRNLHPCRMRVVIATPRAPLALAAQEVIYRVAQECLGNIAKHSQATAVNISVRQADKHIRLCVSDNGAGFSRETASSKPMSFGLAGMKERAVLLGGRLTVRSQPRKGTRVTLQLPVSGQVAPHGKDSNTLN